MFKKTMVLAMAVGLVAALALPAAATAGVWKHHGLAIEGNKELILTGTSKFSSGVVGSIECQTTAEVTVLGAASSTGNVTKFEPDLDEAGSTVTSKCKASGFLSQCQVHSAVANGLPWTVHNKTKTVEITSGDISVGITGGFCPGDTATVTAGTVTGTPNQTKTVTSFTLSGEVTVHILKGGVTQVSSKATVSGTQTIISNAAECASVPATYSLE